MVTGLHDPDQGQALPVLHPACLHAEIRYFCAMKKIHFLVLFLMGTNGWMTAQNPQDLLQAKIDVVYLSSDYLAGRETATEGEKLAAEYIRHRFESLGLKPAGLKGGWLYPFNFQETLNPHDTAKRSLGPVKTGNNVLALLDHGAPNTIVIGAHYDHLGFGGTGSGSLAANDTSIHNGADDNASGVAGLLAIAAKLKNNLKAKNNNYLFIAFSGEEKGLFGSNAYTKDSTLFQAGKVNYMINLDMIGRLNHEKILAINGVGTSPSWKPRFENQAMANGMKISATESGQGPSDHTSFYLKDIPVLHFFTGQHQDYHKPSDDAHKVNYEGILQISDLIIGLIEDLDSKGKLAFTKTKDESGKRAVAFKVSMGVMPDYLYQEGGMRVDGVTEGRPAALAGLQKGDIIVKMGEKAIKDIYAYMEALGSFQKGDRVHVEIKRNGEVKSLEVQF
ncbi:MAG TPA: M20/M25/M40 family metallo-hydrolase [Saprospiraceae bacterium]|nr:M20/M25/M40 family metallo-hydrolase [Saprospiraceae bacterium]HNT21114.1 M20/M25/M40 family metallo-hydrolase [Saprospiraceae bacterium]